MMKIVAYKDARGTIHETMEGCLAADLELALGKIGNGDSSMTSGIAKAIIERREQIMPILRQFPGIDQAAAPDVVAHYDATDDAGIAGISSETKSAMMPA